MNNTKTACDVGDLDALSRTVEAVNIDIGPPNMLIHNAVSETFATFLDADPTALEWNFRVVTGNTASLRGVPSYALFAPTEASLARAAG